MDERSLRRLFEAYSDDLLYYAQYLLHSKEEAEEIVSDVFFEVWQNREKFSEVKQEKLWLLRVTHNKAVSLLRKKGNDLSSVSWEEIGDYGTPRRFADSRCPSDQSGGDESHQPGDCPVASPVPSGVCSGQDRTASL